MSTFTHGMTFEIVHCGDGWHGGGDLYFAMTREFYDRTRRTHETWYCPAGHPRVWGGKTTEQELADARARAQALADQLHAAEVEAESRRAQLVRDRYRWSCGVCPCCNRSFPALPRHISIEHPEYDPRELRKAQTGYRCSCGRSFETPRGLAIHQGKQRFEDWANPKHSWWVRHLTVAESP